MSLTRRSKPNDIYEELRARILFGKLLPRERLVASRLAREFGVSETPIREALNRLHAEGLVMVIPNSGAVVADLTPQMVQEFFAIRSALEGLAARSACPYLTEEHFAALEHHLEQMRLAYQAGSFLGASEHNREFHWVIYRASPFEYLKRLIADLMERTERVRLLFALVPGYFDRQVEDHTKILAAMRARDADAAERLFAQHLRYSAAVTEDLIRRGVPIVMPDLKSGS